MRYVAIRPRQGWEELRETPLLEAKMVHEPEPIDTGLLDPEGNSIYRVTGPIGFVELKERS